MGILIDMLGKSYGELTIISKAPATKGNGGLWNCYCSCGRTVTVRGTNFRLNRHFSCGCVRFKDRKRQKNANWQGYEEIGKKFICHLKNGAKSRGISVSITLEDIWDLYIKQGKVCNLSGIPISFNKPVTASVDRIDSKLPYTVDNIQLVHKDVNKIKNNLDQKYFIDLCRKVAENQKT